MNADTDRANAQALPEATKPAAAPQDEYNHAWAAKLLADARYGIASERKKAEDDAKKAESDVKAEAPKWEASRAFAQAYHAWLTATAGIEDLEVSNEEQPERFRVRTDAERRLFTTPAVWPDQVWRKLTAFELVLGDEMSSGQRRESVLLLALGSIKQDIVNLELLEAA
jgi:hypothetical protein